MRVDLTALRTLMAFMILSFCMLIAVYLDNLELPCCCLSELAMGYEMMSLLGYGGLFKDTNRCGFSTHF